MAVLQVRALSIPVVGAMCSLGLRCMTWCESDSSRKSWQVDENRMSCMVSFGVKVAGVAGKVKENSAWLNDVGSVLRKNGWNRLVKIDQPNCELWKVNKKVDALAKAESEVYPNTPNETTCTIMVLENTNADDVCNMFVDHSYREQWDESTSTIQILDTHTSEEQEKESLIRYETIFPWPLKPREYIIASRLNIVEIGNTHCKVLYQRTASVDIPVQANHVRAPYYEQVYVFNQNGSDAQVVQIFSHDAGAKVPRWVQKTAVKRDFPMFIRRTIDALRTYRVTY